MKKYCVAYINFFDNVLKQEVVETNSLRNALYIYMWNTIGYRGIEDKSYKELVDYAWDCDAMVNAIEI